MSLVARVFLLTTVLVVLPVAAAIVINGVVTRSIGESSVDAVLTASQTVQRSFARQRALELELISQLLASDPAFVGYFAQATAGALPGTPFDTASLVDLLRERQRQFGFDTAMLLDAEGYELARASAAMSVRRDRSDLPLVAEAMRSFLPTSGYWREGERLYQAAVIPVARGGNLIGFLLTGLEVDTEFANEIAAVSGAELVFVGEDTQAETVLASTLPLDRGLAFLAALAAHEPMRDDRPVVVLGGERWAYRFTPVSSTTDGAGRMAALVSLDRIEAPQVNARNYLLMTGIAALAIAILASLLLTRRALRPIGALGEAMRQVVAGDYRQKLSTRGPAELRDLVSSFNELAVGLRQERALDRHLAEVFKSSKAPGERLGDRAALIAPGSVMLDRFEILRSLGIGGMGIVYKALDRELDEIVVLKVLRPEIAGDAANVERLRAEIRVARRITHPNVVRTHDIARIGEQYFISMEYVEGFTLGHLLERLSRLELDAALRVLNQLCLGLGAAHEAGVIHRDLKPDNVMVQFDATVKLMDFGIARPSTAPLSATGDALVEGTAGYLSPEQIQGQPADGRSDIYAFGVIMMELLTGHRPHHGATPYDTCVSQLRDPPRRPSEFWPQVPPDLEAIVLRCLEKQATDRFRDVRELRQALDAARS